MSKNSVAFGGITLPAPRAPYAICGGQVRRALPPTFMRCTPSVQQGMTRFSGKLAGCPRLYVVHLHRVRGAGAGAGAFRERTVDQPARSGRGSRFLGGRIRLCPGTVRGGNCQQAGVDDGLQIVSPGRCIEDVPRRCSRTCGTAIIAAAATRRPERHLAALAHQLSAAFAAAAEPQPPWFAHP